MCVFSFFILVSISVSCLQWHSFSFKIAAKQWQSALMTNPRSVRSDARDYFTLLRTGLTRCGQDPGYMRALLLGKMIPVLKSAQCWALHLARCVINVIIGVDQTLWGIALMHIVWHCQVIFFLKRKFIVPLNTLWILWCPGCVQL